MFNYYSGIDYRMGLKNNVNNRGLADCQSHSVMNESVVPRPQAILVSNKSDLPTYYVFTVTKKYVTLETKSIKF